MPVAFNSRADARLALIGRNGIAVSTIDHVLQDAEGVAELGFAQSYATDPDNFYPGVRAAVPDSFSFDFCAWLTPILQRNGHIAAHQAFHQATSCFSVVTTASQNLLPIQRIPHYDSTDPQLFAAVIYLCDTRFSGTSFYRHRRTGYEEITAATRDNYQLALDSELRKQGPPPREYVNGSNARFEAIFTTDLRFNSMVIYPGRALHAGNIQNPFQPPNCPDDWRLTITALLQLKYC